VAYGVLPQEDVGQVSEVFVDEGGRRCMPCCWAWAQLVLVAAELLHEHGCFDLRGGWNQELSGDPKGLVIDELSRG